MKAYIVSRTPSIRKAMGTEACPFPIIWTNLKAAYDACDHMNKRYGLHWDVYQIEVKIIAKDS